MLHSLRYTFRQLRQRPGITLAVILTLAIGIAGNTVAFSWMDRVILRSIPGIGDTSSLAALEWRSHDGSFRALSWLNGRDLQARLTRSQMAIFTMRPVNLGESGRPERIWSLMVSANYFDAVGVTVPLGRGFAREDDAKPGEPATAVLADHFWKARYGGDPGAIGRNIRLNNREFTIIGVAAPEFQGHVMGLRFDVFVPVTMGQALFPQAANYTDRGTNWLEAFLRLKPGVSLEEGLTELNGVKAQLHRSLENNDLADRANGEPIWRYGAGKMLGPFAILLTVTVGLVLLIVCANIANLLLAQALGRQRDVAIRLALGVSRGRLIRQMLGESLVLGLAGGVLGLILAPWIMELMNGFTPPLDLPMHLQMRLNWRVAFYTFGVSLLAGLVFGLAPAVRVSRPDLITALKDEGTAVSTSSQKSFLQRSLVVAQVALSCVLLVCSGLLLRSLQRAANMNPGFDTSQTMVATVDLYSSGYDAASGRVFAKELLERLRNLPGVVSASVTTGIPLEPGLHSYYMEIRGYTPAPREQVVITVFGAGPDYARTLGMPLVRGRDLGDEDGPDGPLAILVNQAFADRYLAGRDPLGAEVRFGGGTWKVAGVLGTAKYQSLSETARPVVFYSVNQKFASQLNVVTRGTGDPQRLGPMMRQVLQELDPDLPVYNFRTFEDATSFGYLPQRMGGTTLAIIGALALLLACIGLYGVLAYTVVQRTREMGIRMALGAERVDILGLVVGQGMRLTLVGLGLGLAIAFASARLLSGQLFGVSPHDPVVFTGVPVLLAAIAAAASYLPARRAMRIDPIQAIRHE